LGLRSGSSTAWDLVFSSGPGNITSPTSNLSGLGTSFTTIFDGGKLVVDSTNATTTSAFTLKKNTTGAIDQGGNKTSTFSGVFADDVAAGAASKLTITNSGTSTNALAGAVTLSGVNTYTGGTKVEAGATLAVTNPNAIGTGVLELVGTATISANFAALNTMTISNAVTVEGDPTFTAAPGTTLTISTAITDGASAGDVVIGGTGGGGTVVLTAVNTYTGNTTVDSGNTLVLSGSGSIAVSGTDPTIGTGIFNNGTFNIAPATANTVTLGTNYTQSGSGNLGMNWYQKLSIAGSASLAGTLTLFNSNSSSYALGRYTLLASTGGRSGSFGTLDTTNLSSSYSYSLSYDANDAYLTIAPSADYTQQSLVNTAQVLQGTFALQSSILNSSLGYDCNLFGPNGICISTGGRNTAVQAQGINNTSALLIAAYKILPSVRIGAYADQNLSTQGPGTVQLGNNTPLLGMFAAWNQRNDGTGLEIKGALAYGQKSATVTRSVVATSEPGSGGSNLTTQGAQLVGKYGFAVTPDTIVSPYAGVRYSQANMGGYTEGTSAAVTAPLTYQALNTNATTLLAGASASHQLNPKTTVFASAGIESDTSTTNGTYSASSSSIAGLTPINFNPTAVKNRPTAMVGTYYYLEKNQRLALTAGYTQTPYKAVSTTTVMAMYTIGL
jgi:autotransporter-associated beta strand protein